MWRARLARGNFMTGGSPTETAPDAGCAFIIDGAAPAIFCGAPRLAGSAYCGQHHAHCRIAAGSAAERRRLREIEALAATIGGTRGRQAREPPHALMRRLDRA